MLPLYGLPGLPETKPKLKGYSIGLLAMYITHTAGTAVSLPCYNPSDLETLESRRFNMHLCIIYKAYYNLAMFPLLDYATPITVQPGVITSNSSCPTAAKMCLNTLSYLLHSEVGMPSHSQQWRLHPWNCSRPAFQVLHSNAAPNCFYPALSGCFVVKCTFSLLFFFSAHHVSLSVLTARD